MPAQPPRYVQIADELREQIRRGRYAPGDQLPTGGELMERYEVKGSNTIKQALDVLRAEGLILTRAGRGTFVADPLPEKRLSDMEQVHAELAELRARVDVIEREQRERRAFG